MLSFGAPPLSSFWACAWVLNLKQAAKKLRRNSGLRPTSHCFNWGDDGRVRQHPSQIENIVWHNGIALTLRSGPTATNCCPYSHREHRSSPRYNVYSIIKGKDATLITNQRRFILTKGQLQVFNAMDELSIGDNVFDESSSRYWERHYKTKCPLRDIKRVSFISYKHIIQYLIILHDI